MGRQHPFVKEDTFGRKVNRIKGRAKPWVLRFARFGHMAKGVVYLVIGLLALQSAFGLGGKLISSKGALYVIAQQPFGLLLLIILAAGLSGYACWQIVMALFDPENKGSDLKGIVARIGYVVIAGIYTGTCYSAIKILFHARVDTSNEHYQTLSAKMLAQPFGQTAIGLLGAVILIVGIIQVSKALSGRFQKKFKKNEMTRKEWKWSGHIGKVGISARGLVFSIIGIFLIRTAIQADPDETKGLDGALAEVAQQPFGPVLLTIVSMGLIAYGVYMFAEARYKRLNP
ncbi:DUF1206 domain-containing protein [Peribacillus cavernae]|uniref:DUF1206 domain-containing protein n=1 Tax=Peribacillus cavernae TaxID=1674310 RepID=A0A433HBW3_9BACI|nr:DUF1206 domain-containing protein [Peribacillus cavernae]MDQ0219616.1 Flp pilus assembly pilin Flp [Peribacillus cavernae]RUQ25904.1 DUF1206 domain-containing protein [Peribacillus cavernae]